MGKPFTVQLMRSMPYPSTWFLVYIGGSTSPAALISKVSGGFKRSTDVLEYKEGGSRIIRQGPARTKYEPITLERGVTQDIDFMNWANAVQVLDKGSPSSSLKNLRQNLRIDLLREDLVPVNVDGGWQHKRTRRCRQPAWEEFSFLFNTLVDPGSGLTGDRVD
jgi:phage tail-like protein